MAYRIGEFSLITRLPAKTLRYYHEIGLLEPERIDGESGYRIYTDRQVDRARLIRRLRDLEFPLEAVRRFLDRVDAGESIVDVVEEHQASVSRRLRDLQTLAGRLERLAAGAPRAGEVGRRRLDPELYVGVRFVGDYSDIGRRFVELTRAVGDLGIGPPFALYWQAEYRPGQADITVAMPVARPLEIPGSVCEVLPGGEALVTVHRGPYESIGDAYGRLFAGAAACGCEIGVPIRDRYLRGPGGREDPAPQDFLTEVVMPISGSGR